jgi:hypothetical protein
VQLKIIITKKKIDKGNLWKQILVKTIFGMNHRISNYS